MDPSFRRHPRPRLGLVDRKRLHRRVARGRIARHVRTPMSAAQRAYDPLAHGDRAAGSRLVKVAGALLGSTAVHAAVVALGLVAGGVHLGRREVIHQEVKIEVRERQPLPPPPPPPEVPRPEEIPRPVAPPPKVAKTPPPEPKGPPPRVVGLSLEATAEGGGGPSFAVGNTTAGKTAERAVDPKEVVAAPPEAPPEAPPANRAASHIPVAGVKYAAPKRKVVRKPPYPETLKAQGIEADVPVMVSLDATGKVLTVKILKETPYPELNESARQAALTEEWEPATRDGLPIPYTLSYTYKFRLEDQ